MRFLALILAAAMTPAAFAFDHAYAKWDKFLRTYVTVHGNASKVNYKLAKAGRQDLDAFVNEWQGVTKSEYNGWTDAQKQAFLINGYNALTVKWILDNHIPASIKDTGSLFSSPWKKKFFKMFGEEAYLDKIEHDTARASFNNCRFHFAFNCASIGCPMLRNEAWLPEKLPQQLEDSATKFIQDKSRNMYDEKSNSLEISKIFDWYGKDFDRDKSCGGVKNFVAKHMGRNIPDSAKIKYLDYDWKLNAE